MEKLEAMEITQHLFFVLFYAGPQITEDLNVFFPIPLQGGGEEVI